MLGVAFGRLLKAYRQSFEYMLKMMLQTCHSHFDHTKEDGTMSAFCTFPVNQMFVLSSLIPNHATATLRSKPVLLSLAEYTRAM